MPTISLFYGIVIRMYFDDHDPPHFHATYNEFEAVIGILDFGVLEGDLPPKALGLVMEWARIHKNQLLADWELARSRKPLSKIEPLD